MVNRFPGRCTQCGRTVSGGSGIAERNAHGKWVVRHQVCGEEAPKVEPLTFTPTAEQAQAIALFATGKSLVIQAGAGAGKTSTLRLLAQSRPDAVFQYTAFNKKIVTDCKASMPDNVKCNTAHSLAFGPVGKAYSHRVGGARLRPAELAKLLGVTAQGPLAEGFVAGLVLRTVDAWAHTADAAISAKHVPEVANDEVDVAALERYVVPRAQAAWADLVDPNGKLPFKHDHYLKLWQISDPVIAADVILFDEAQDADPVMVSIIEQQLARGVQVVVVGDSQQAIYEWRGAVDALARFAALGAEVTKLTESFRFGPEIAEVANGILTKLHADLRLTGAGKPGTVGATSAPTALLTRTNGGAIRALLQEIDKGGRPHLVGGGSDVIAFARAARDLQGGRRTNHPQLGCFATWGEVQEHSDTEDGKDLQLLVRIITEHGADEIIDLLERAVPEDRATLVVSTAHKSKGAQWPIVKLAGDFFGPRKKGDPLDPAEARLLYVAATRAQQHLDVTAVAQLLA